MNDILRILLGEARPRQAADESLFLSGRNYLGVHPPMPNIPPVAGLPPVPPQVGPVAGLVTINDNGQIFQLAPGEVYEGGIRIIPGPAPTFTGLLDDYPGAAAAYSLRRMSVNYTGPLVQVRRASDNDETTIPYKDDGTLDVGVLNAFAAGTDAFVSEWPDQSGNANDATQTTAANQPKIYDSSTGVVTENGKPAVQFDGSNDTMSASSSLTNEVTILLVYRRDTSAGNYILDGNNSTRLAVGGITTQVEFQLYVSSAVAGLAELFNQQNLGYVLANQTNSEIALNGGTVTTGSSGNAVNTSIVYFGSRLGGSGFLNGKIQEVVYYNSNQSANRAGIESNINTYYSIY